MQERDTNIATTTISRENSQVLINLILLIFTMEAMPKSLRNPHTHMTTKIFTNLSILMNTSLLSNSWLMIPNKPLMIWFRKLEMSSELLLMKPLTNQNRDVKPSMTLLRMLVTSLLLFWVILLVMQLIHKLLTTKEDLIVSKLIPKLDLMRWLHISKSKEISLTNGSETDLSGPKSFLTNTTESNFKRNWLQTEMAPLQILIIINSKVKKE